ncbi:hypothetical protein, partial [Alistipes putredinis]|uniref:hypothetical protein n=2 Tax=Alistipes putredinis TaxID=28117 RepID=UPI0026589B33
SDLGADFPGWVNPSGERGGGSVILYQISEIGGSAYTHHAIGISLFGFCRAWRYCNQPFSQEYAPVFG